MAAQNLRRAADTARSMPLAWVEDSASTLQARLQAAGQSVGWPPGSATVSTRVSGGIGRASAEVTAGNRGKWQVAEFGIRPHTIRVRNARGMPTSRGVRAKVQHPGVKAPHKWTTTVPDVLPVLRADWQRRLGG